VSSQSPWRVFGFLQIVQMVQIDAATAVTAEGGSRLPFRFLFLQVLSITDARFLFAGCLKILGLRVCADLNNANHVQRGHAACWTHGQCLRY
jgi:hypothetical protein